MSEPLWTGQESPETERSDARGISTRTRLRVHRVEEIRNESDPSISRNHRGVRRVHVPAFFLVIVHKARFKSVDSSHNVPDGNAAESGHFSWSGAGFHADEYPIPTNAVQFLTSTPRVATVASHIKPSRRLAILMRPRLIPLTPDLVQHQRNSRSPAPQPGRQPLTPSRASFGDVESLEERSVPVSQSTH